MGFNAKMLQHDLDDFRIPREEKLHEKGVVFELWGSWGSVASTASESSKETDLDLDDLSDDLPHSTSLVGVKWLVIETKMPKN